MLGILDLRSLGYYKIKQNILQQNLSKYYRFEKADTLCEQCNKFINTLKKDKKKTCLMDKEKKKQWICYINIKKHLVKRWNRYLSKHRGRN